MRFRQPIAADIRISTQRSRHCCDRAGGRPAPRQASGVAPTVRWWLVIWTS